MNGKISNVISVNSFIYKSTVLTDPSLESTYIVIHWTHTHTHILQFFQ